MQETGVIRKKQDSATGFHENYENYNLDLNYLLSFIDRI